jgi:hypothetical protein
MEQDVLDNIVTPTNNLIELTLARLNDDRWCYECIQGD